MACFDLDRISPMAMPAKNTATIVTPIIAALCGGLLTAHSCLAKSSWSRLSILESPFKQEMVLETRVRVSRFLRQGLFQCCAGTRNRELRGQRTARFLESFQQPQQIDVAKSFQ